MDTTAGTDDSNALIAWANEGVVDVLLRTKCYVDDGDMTLTSASADYRLDTVILVFLDAHIVGSSGSNPALERLTVPQLLEKRRSSNNSGSVRYFAVQGDQLLVYPTPSTTTTLRIYLVPRPTAMSNDSNSPDSATYGGIPSEYHKAIEAYMMWQAAESQGDFSGQLETAYDRRIAFVKRALVNKAGPLPRAKLAPLRNTVPSDPAVLR